MSPRVLVPLAVARVKSRDLSIFAAGNMDSTSAERLQTLVNCGGEIEGGVFDRMFGDVQQAIDMDGYDSMPLLPRLLVLLQVAYFLEELHGMGLIYRDLKPSNILVARDITKMSDTNAISMYKDKSRLVAFGDFGTLATESRPSTPHVGTVGYMPLVQLQGGRLTADIDLFAFGVVIVDVLSGILFCPASMAESEISREAHQPLLMLARLRTHMESHSTFRIPGIERLAGNLLLQQRSSLGALIAVLEITFDSISCTMIQSNQ
jgi:serine/threonine protein kinase